METTRFPFHYEINWVFNPDLSEKSQVYKTMQSIWNVHQAVISGHLESSKIEVLTNLIFDTFEIYRKECLNAIKGKPITPTTSKIIQQYYDNADQEVKKWLKACRNGKDEYQLRLYNEYIAEQLGINNMELFIKEEE